MMKFQINLIFFIIEKPGFFSSLKKNTVRIHLHNIEKLHDVDVVQSLVDLDLASGVLYVALL